MRTILGTKLAIELTSDARASFFEAESLVPGAKAACHAQLQSLLQRLADQGSLRSKDQWTGEALGVWVLRCRNKVCACGWFHDHRQGVFVISHFGFELKQPLDDADISRVDSNRSKLYWSERHAKSH